MSIETSRNPSPSSQGKGSARTKKAKRSLRPRNFLKLSSLITIALFILFGGALVAVCFLGLPVAGPNTYAHLKSPQRVISSLTFSYESEIRTRQARDERAGRVNPVYTITMAPYTQFVEAWNYLMQRLDELEEDAANTASESPIPLITREEFHLLAIELNEKFGYQFAASDLETLYKETTAASRKQISQKALTALEGLFAKGIYPNQSDQDSSEDTAQILTFSFLRSDTQLPSEQMESLQNAGRTLYIEITGATMGYSGDLARALNGILQNSLVPNIEYDQERTLALRREAMERVRPVVERIQEGDIIVDTGAKLGPLEHERLNAYRNELKRQQSEYHWPRLKQEIVLTLIILTAVFLFLRCTQNNFLRDHYKVASVIMLTLVQLGITRLLIELTDSPVFAQHPLSAHVLPYLIPYYLAPILLGVLLGIVPGLVISVFVGLFIALMFNGSLLIFVISVFSSVVGLYFSQNIRKRSKLVRSGILAGVATACCPIIIGLALDTELSTILIQVVITLGIGFITGTLLVGLLPVMENLFHYTTDITLLELTDYNHPLLRELQLRAPGSYHHSLMLANLTEHAAAAIGANPLVARVCSYYHDVGKMVKPEYFIENQRDGVNPHLEKNPSMSALVIKAHVKEGVALAQQHKLPKVIIDVIQQHHGTSLIQYFFSMAKNRERQKTRDPFGVAVPNEPSEISESTYRYDGPRPRFRESAIVFFGDAVEAASRTIKKVSVQNIEELIDKLFNDRIQDGQLDECPITMFEIQQIKKSFVFTLINSLHARIDYPAPVEEPVVDKNEDKLNKDKESSNAGTTSPQ